MDGENGFWDLRHAETNAAWAGLILTIARRQRSERSMNCKGGSLHRRATV